MTSRHRVPARLTAEHRAEVVTLVENGPDLAKTCLVRWSRVALRDWIKDRFGRRRPQP